MGALVAVGIYLLLTIGLDEEGDADDTMRQVSTKRVQGVVAGATGKAD